MKKLSHIFFDLDHTLWDYDSNARNTLEEMYQKYRLETIFSSSEAFLKVFYHVNFQLWDQYNASRIDRDYIRKNRFRIIMEGRIDPDPDLFEELSDFFVSTCPTKPRMMPGAADLLNSLHKEYVLGIITNGFDDVQNIKLKSCGISEYFDCVITSETTGHRKPQREIFDHALEIYSVRSEEVLMIGDNPETDIKGAMTAGWKSIWYNPEKRNHFIHSHEIHHLAELMDHL